MKGAIKIMDSSSSMSAQSLGLRLKALREQHHLKQYELAELIFVSPQSYSAYENGKRLPNILILSRMARVYHVTLDFLVTGDAS